MSHHRRRDDRQSRQPESAFTQGPFQSARPESRRHHSGLERQLSEADHKEQEKRRQLEHPDAQIIPSRRQDPSLRHDSDGLGYGRQPAGHNISRGQTPEQDRSENNSPEHDMQGPDMSQEEWGFEEEEEEEESVQRTTREPRRGLPPLPRTAMEVPLLSPVPRKRDISEGTYRITSPDFTRENPSEYSTRDRNVLNWKKEYEKSWWRKRSPGKGRGIND